MAAVAAFTLLVLILNFADVLPDWMVTVFGTIAFLSLDVMGMSSPPSGAGLLMATIPWQTFTPMIVGEANLKDVMVGAVMGSGVVGPAALRRTLIFAGLLTAMATVLTLNVAVVLPAGIAISSGTAEFGLSEDIWTRRP